MNRLPDARENRILPVTLLVLLGGFMVAGASRLARLPGVAGHGGNLTLLIGAMVLLYLAALAVAWRWRGASSISLPLILAVGLAVRAPLVVRPPLLSDDIYRYLWDGRVAAAGINPFRYAPCDTALAGLRDAEVWPKINHPELVTIYPPTTQFVFRAAAGLRLGVGGFKALLILIDLALALLIAATAARAPAGRWRLLLYWWHPLPIIEFAGSGHSDVIGMLLLTAAFVVADREGVGRARGWLGGVTAGALAAAAALVKFLALPAALFLASRQVGRTAAMLAAFGLTALLFYFPYLAPGVNPFGSLPTYAARWRANDVIFGLVLRPGTAIDQDARLTQAKIVVAGLLVVGLAVLALARASRPLAMATALGAAVYLSPTVHPWYVAWLLPFLAWRFSAAWLIATLTVFVAYSPLPVYAAGGGWHESLALKVAALAPVAVAGVGEILLRRAPFKSKSSP